MTSACSGIAAPSGRLPVTVKVPAWAYFDAGTSCQVTATGRLTPSAYVAITVAGRTGASPIRVFTAVFSTLSTSWSGW